MRRRRSPAATLTVGCLLIALASGPAFAAEERESPPKQVSREELMQWVAGAPDRAPLGPARSRFAMLSTGAGLVWSPLGPKPITNEYWSGNADAGGRVSAVLVHPSDPSLAYLAGAQGGVWKTTNGGATWTPLTDGLSSLSSGALAFAPGDPNTLYYGTGEMHQSIDSYAGDGLFRSTDAGATWSKIASRFDAGNFIARVGVNPADPNIIYVASSRGLVRSVDGGANWTVTLVPPNAPNWCSDLAIDPVSNNIVYASLYQQGIYKSVDSGATWTLLAGGLPASGSGFQRINFALAPSNPLVLYASFENSGSLLGMYRTADGGVTWTKLTATPNYMGGQGWYDNTVVVDPANANICYAGGVYPYNSSYRGVIKTTNGGASWTDVTIGVDGQHPHPDQHFLTFGPDGTLWLANDGGVWKTSDGGSHWINCNATLALAQFYSLALHPADPTRILGGTQDNGTLIYQGTMDWPELIAGDGGPCLFEWDSPNIFYSTYVNLRDLLKWDNGAYQGEVTGPWEGFNDRAAWCDGPLVTDPNQPNTLLAGTYRVWRSLNSGGSWTAISSDLAPFNGVLLGLAVANGNSDVIYASTSNGRVQVTTNGGGLWTLRNTGLPAVEFPDVILDPANPARAFICAKQVSGGRVYRTVDSGISWSSLTGDLPAGPRPFSLAVDFRVTPARLYLGTDAGLYVSVNDGVNWVLANNGLPTMTIDDLAVDIVNSYLVAATHGRGMYRATLDVTAPAVAVTVPNGGEFWEQGTVQNVTWNATDLNGVDAVTLTLSTDGGATYPTPIATGIPNSGSYAWTLPNSVSSTCRVKVVATDPASNAAEDISDADFHIYDALSVDESASLGFALHPLAPNPIRLPAAIEFQLPRAGEGVLDVFDVHGRHVRRIAAGIWEAGRHVERWDGRDGSGRAVGDGVYFCRLRAGAFEQIQRMTLLR